MASDDKIQEEEYERRSKRKLDTAIGKLSLSTRRLKQPSRRGGKGGVDIGLSPRELAHRDMQMLMEGRSIRPDACPGTPEHLAEFDNSYMEQ